MTGMVVDAERALNQIRYSRTGPERRFVTELLRPFEQPIHQTLTLTGIEQGQPPGPSGRFQGFLAVLGGGPCPSAHRLAAYL